MTLLRVIATFLVTISLSPCTNAEERGEKLRIVAFSDINGSVGSTHYIPGVHQGVKDFLRRQPDLVIGVGDYIAGGDIGRRLPDSAFPRMWQVFSEQILSRILVQSVPFVPTPGNHEASGYQGFERERRSYEKFWSENKPRVQYINQDNYPWFFSYMVDGVFFISLDDVKVFSLHNSSVQKEWLKEQLSSPLAREAKARIVYGHVPIFAVLDQAKHSRGNNRGKYHEILNHEQWNTDDENDNSLERILTEGGVNLTVFAHSHAYYPGVVIRQHQDGPTVLRILSLPCMGPGSRYLHRGPMRSREGYSLIEVDLSNGEIDYEMFTYAGELMQKTLLPERIPQNDAKVNYIRDDLFFR